MEGIDLQFFLYYTLLELEGERAGLRDRTARL
jgi:hypothetical protein